MRVWLMVVAACGLIATAGMAQETEVRTDWGTFKFERSNGVTEGIVSAPIDTVFAVLPTVLKELGVEIKDKDPASHALQARRQRVYQKLGKERVSVSLACGDGLTGPNADNYYVYLTMVVELGSGAAGKTNLRMTFMADAVDVPGGRSERLPCASTGRLEYRLADRLQRLFPATP